MPKESRKRQERYSELRPSYIIPGAHKLIDPQVKFELDDKVNQYLLKNEGMSRHTIQGQINRCKLELGHADCDRPGSLDAYNPQEFYGKYKDLFKKCGNYRYMLERAYKKYSDPNDVYQESARKGHQHWRRIWDNEYDKCKGHLQDYQKTLNRPATLQSFISTTPAPLAPALLIPTIPRPYYRQPLMSFVSPATTSATISQQQESKIPMIVPTQPQQAKQQVVDATNYGTKTFEEYLKIAADKIAGEAASKLFNENLKLNFNLNF